MKALVYKKPGRKNGAVQEIPIPECGDTEVLIKIMACGICKPAERTHDGNGSVLGVYPAVPGHEMAGLIEKTGDKVTSVKPRMRVTIDNGIPCGTCYYCKRGQTAFCENFGSMGHNLQGGMAQYVAVEEKYVHCIPEEVSYDQAAICELIGCCLRAVERSRLQYCDDVLILGAGASGNILAQIYCNSGAGRVAVLDKVTSKLELLKEKGCMVWKCEEGNEEIQLMEMKKIFPEGFNIIVDACGNIELARKALENLKKGGTFVGYSFPSGELKEFPLPVGRFIMNEWTYVGSTFNSEFEKCIDMIKSKKVDVQCLLTGHYPLDEYFIALDENIDNPESIKVIIHPNNG